MIGRKCIRDEDNNLSRFARGTIRSSRMLPFTRFLLILPLAALILFLFFYMRISHVLDHAASSRENRALFGGYVPSSRYHRTRARLR